VASTVIEPTSGPDTKDLDHGVGHSVKRMVPHTCGLVIGKRDKQYIPSLSLAVAISVASIWTKKGVPQGGMPTVGCLEGVRKVTNIV
jgi:hypothetical protein